MQHLKYLFLTFMVCLTISCDIPDKEQTNQSAGHHAKETGKLISIDFTDTIYSSMIPNAKDTTTSSGWEIKYFVKDDSTKYNNVYIKCKKGDIQGVFCVADMLQMRSYFLPVLKAETNNHIYFSHGCATDCSALLVFTKDSTGQYTDYAEVVNYDIPLGQIVYVTDSSYQNEENIYELGIASLSKRKTYKLTFLGICDAAFKPGCVDTITFSKKQISVTVSLRDSIGSNEQTKQTKTVRL